MSQVEKTSNSAIIKRLHSLIEEPHRTLEVIEEIIANIRLLK